MGNPIASIGDRIILKNICDPAITGVYKGELLPLEENIWLYKGAMGTIFNIDQCFKPNTYHILFNHALLPNLFPREKDYFYISPIVLICSFLFYT